MNNFTALFDPVTVRKEFAADGKGARVAILDTGLASRVPFRDRVVATRDMCNPSSPTVDDRDGHGTQLAGLVHEVAPGCSLLIARTLPRNGFFTHEALADGIAWAVHERADVICVATGEKDRDSVVEQVVSRTMEKNALVVSAIGNRGEKLVGAGCYPARFPSSVAVGAVDQDGNVMDFSDENPEVTMICAPGHELIVPDLDDLVVTSGTSLAAAYTAGVLALAVGWVRANGLIYDAGHLKALLIKTALPVTSGHPSSLLINARGLFEALSRQG